MALTGLQDLQAYFAASMIRRTAPRARARLLTYLNDLFDGTDWQASLSHHYNVAISDISNGSPVTLMLFDPYYYERFVRSSEAVNEANVAFLRQIIKLGPEAADNCLLHSMRLSYYDLRYLSDIVRWMKDSLPSDEQAAYQQHIQFANAIHGMYILPPFLMYFSPGQVGKTLILSSIIAPFTFLFFLQLPLIPAIFSIIGTVLGACILVCVIMTLEELHQQYRLSANTLEGIRSQSETFDEGLKALTQRHETLWAERRDQLIKKEGLSINSHSIHTVYSFFTGAKKTVKTNRSTANENHREKPR